MVGPFHWLLTTGWVADGVRVTCLWMDEDFGDCPPTGYDSRAGMATVRVARPRHAHLLAELVGLSLGRTRRRFVSAPRRQCCLLYTSDAADE